MVQVPAVVKADCWGFVPLLGAELLSGSAIVSPGPAVPGSLNGKAVAGLGAQEAVGVRSGLCVCLQPWRSFLLSLGLRGGTVQFDSELACRWDDDIRDKHRKSPSISLRAATRPCGGSAESRHHTAEVRPRRHEAQLTVSSWGKRLPLRRADPGTPPPPKPTCSKLLAVWMVSSSLNLCS